MPKKIDPQDVVGKRFYTFEEAVEYRKQMELEIYGFNVD